MKVKMTSNSTQLSQNGTEPPAQTKSSIGVDDAISLVNSYFKDRHVEQQTIALLNHLSERLQIAEANQAALMRALEVIASDSSTSRDTMLTAIAAISDRMAEAPQVNVTVPVPEVHVEAPSPRKIEFNRDNIGRITSAEEVE